MSRKLPQRVDLVSQVCELLRESIHAGELGSYLPGEVELAARFQVGRNTMRKALEQLTFQGLIETGHAGRRRRVLGVEKAYSPAVREIRMLSPFGFDFLPPMALRLVDEMRSLFSTAGYSLEMRTGRAFQLKRPEKILQNLVDQNPAAAWILHQTTQPMQQWFQTRNIPAVILGMPHPGIRVPAVTADMRAVARHAAGILLAKGHEHIVLLRNAVGLAGSEELEHGFREGMEAHGIPPEAQRIVPVEASMERVCTILDRLLKQGKPISGFLVESSWIVPTVVTYLASRERLCPRDYSLVSLFDHPGLENLVPEIARYETDHHREIRRLVQLAMRAAEQGAYLDDPVTFFPEFKPGKSLGNA